MSRRPPGRVAVVGAGAAGALFALELSRLRPGTAIDLYDRGGAPPGAGIVLSWDFADGVKADHPRVFDLPGSALATWDRTLTIVAGERVWSGAYGMFGVSRREFNGHLRNLASGLPNVTPVRRTVPRDPGGYDLVVAADGARSRLRTAREGDFGTRSSEGRTRFLWMSTPIALEPTFVLKPVCGGVLIVHSYPHGPDVSTFIVEADAGVLARLGLLDRPLPEIEGLLAELFADELGGAPLHAQTRGWRAFTTIVNERWHSGRVVLAGDAAHTVHFSTGSGTALAIDDARCLARALAEDPSDALDAYEAARRPVIRAAQEEAAESRHWFETLSRRERVRGHQTVFALRSRRTANTYDRLRARDPDFVAAALRTLAAGPAEGEPADLPLRIGGIDLTGRYAEVTDDAQGTRTLRLPTADCHGQCAIVHPGAPLPHRAPRCVLITSPPPDLTPLTRTLRSRGATAIGLLLPPPEPPRPAELAQFVGVARSAGVGGVDFLVVSAGVGGGRGERTRVADEVGYASGLPVLLLSAEPMSRDEVNTLVLGGRIALFAHAAGGGPAPPEAAPDQGG
ncbi:FAD-dependent monooxygenase [Spirillospora sp. NPDC047418]